MSTLNSMSNEELLARMPKLVRAERHAMADVIAHLVEIQRRKSYLSVACASLSAFCIERLGYSEDEAVKRVRVSRLALRFPSVLEELRQGSVHLSGLVLLAPHMTPENHAELLTAARGKSKRAIEAMLAALFPQPDLPDRVGRDPEQLAVPGLVGGARAGTEGPKPAPEPLR